MNSVDSFARRLLQVGHELRHIEHYRTGLAGGQHKNRRAFFAFHDEAHGDAGHRTHGLWHSADVSHRPRAAGL